MNKQEAIIFCDNIMKHFDNSDELTFYDLVKLTIKEDPNNPNGWNAVGIPLGIIPGKSGLKNINEKYPNL